jgi:hypothetical protein
MKRKWKESMKNILEYKGLKSLIVLLRILTTDIIEHTHEFILKHFFRGILTQDINNSKEIALIFWGADDLLAPGDTLRK